MDHDKQLVYCETLSVSSLTALSPARLNGDASSSGGAATATANLGLLGAAQPSDEQVAARLSAPVVTTQLDTRNIAFERSDSVLLRSPLTRCYDVSTLFFVLMSCKAMKDCLKLSPH